MTNYDHQHKAYLNTANFGLISSSANMALLTYQEAIHNYGSAAAKEYAGKPQTVKGELAKLLSCQPEELAFGPNFSYPLSALIQSFKGKKILLYDKDYPSITLPFKINGFDITWVSAPDDFTVSLDEIIDKALKNKIEVIAISHVQYLSGYKIDLEKLGSFCQEKDIVLVVDTTQSLGAVELNMEKLHIDVMISSSYKWLNAGYGGAVIYMSQAFLEQHKPQLAGFNSMSFKDGELTYQHSVNSYEPGSVNQAFVVLLEQALIDKKEWGGIAKIESHNTHLINNFIDRVIDLPIKILGKKSPNRAAIVSFTATLPLVEHLKSEGVEVTFRAGSIRVSPHFYNSTDEMDLLADLLLNFY